MTAQMDWVSGRQRTLERVRAELEKGPLTVDE